MRKLKRIIMDFNQNAKRTRPQTSYLNKMLDQSLYILDLLPRSAAPILIIFSDSNLYISRLGRYNNILMQFNRVDININFIDLFNYSGNMNLYALGLISNKSIMSYISRFTGGCFFTEEKISKITKSRIIDKNSKLPFSGSNSKNIYNRLNSQNTSNENYSATLASRNSIISLQNKENFNGKNHNNFESFKNIESVKYNQDYNFQYQNGDELITLNYSKCRNCDDNVNIFFCKKPFQEKYLTASFIINNEALKDLKKTNSQINFTLNFLDLFKRYKEINIYQKETVIKNFSL